MTLTLLIRIILQPRLTMLGGGQLVFPGRAASLSGARSMQSRARASVTRLDQLTDARPQDCMLPGTDPVLEQTSAEDRTLSVTP